MRDNGSQTLHFPSVAPHFSQPEPLRSFTATKVRHPSSPWSLSRSSLRHYSSETESHLHSHDTSSSSVAVCSFSGPLLGRKHRHRKSIPYEEFPDRSPMKSRDVITENYQDPIYHQCHGERQRYLFPEEREQSDGNT